MLETQHADMEIDQTTESTRFIALTCQRKDTSVSSAFVTSPHAALSSLLKRDVRLLAIIL